MLGCGAKPCKSLLEGWDVRLVFIILGTIHRYALTDVFRGGLRLGLGVLIGLLCGSVLWEDKVYAGSEVVGVGVLLPLSGPLSVFGKASRLSYELASAEINAKGGIHGKAIRFYFVDTRGRAERGRHLAQTFINERKVVMLAGGFDLEVSKAVAEVAVERGFPFMIHSTMADRLTVVANYPGSGKGKEQTGASLEEFPVFRISPAMGESMGVLEEFLKRAIKPKSVVVIREESVFGEDVTDHLAKLVKRLGVDDLEQVTFQSEGRSPFRSLMKVKQKSYDVVFLASVSRTAEKLALAAMEAGLAPKVIIGIGRGFNHPRFMENVGKAGEKLMTVSLWHPELPYSADQNYPRSYQDRTNKESQADGAQAYAAAWVIQDGLMRAESFSSVDIVKSLRQTDLMTVIGPVKFANFNDKVNQNMGMTCMTQWLGNRQWIVWPQNLANRGYVYPINWIQERR